MAASTRGPESVGMLILSYALQYLHASGSLQGDPRVTNHQYTALKDGRPSDRFDHAVSLPV